MLLTCFTTIQSAFLSSLSRKKKTKNIIIFAKNMKDMERINNVLVYLRFIASGQNEVQVIKSIIMR